MLSRVHTVLWVGVAVVLSLCGGLALYEWYRVGIEANPQVIARYPFGSEGSAAGVSAYSSASAYARNALQTWVFAFGLLGIVLFAAQRKSTKLLFVSYAVFGLAYIGRVAGAL
jgi:hypothetical protein